MENEIIVDIELDGLQEFVQKAESLFRGNESYTAKAIERAGEVFIQEWIKTAESKFKHTDGSYAQGIQNGADYPYNGDPLHFKIVHTSKNAYWLEKGYDSFDMKKMLDSSAKVRISKKGKRYLIIPFRHGNPNSVIHKAMPTEIYKQAVKLRQSKIIGTYEEGIVQGAQSFKEAEIMRANNPNKVKRNLYKWGEHLNLGDDSYKIYNGMVRFNSNPNTARDKIKKTLSKFINNSNNEKQYSTYLTFRVMSESSNGWIHPAQKPMNILGETIQRVEGMIRQIVNEGVQSDLDMIRNL